MMRERSRFFLLASLLRKEQVMCVATAQPGHPSLGLAQLPWPELRDLSVQVLKPTERQEAPVIFWWATRGGSMNTNERGKNQKKKKTTTPKNKQNPAGKWTCQASSFNLFCLSVTVLSLPLSHFASHFLSGISLRKMQIQFAASRFKNQLHNSSMGKVQDLTRAWL